MFADSMANFRAAPMRITRAVRQTWLRQQIMSSGSVGHFIDPSFKLSQTRAIGSRHLSSLHPHARHANASAPPKANGFTGSRPACAPAWLYGKYRAAARSLTPNAVLTRCKMRRVTAHQSCGRIYRADPCLLLFTMFRAGICVLTSSFRPPQADLPGGT